VKLAAAGADLVRHPRRPGFVVLIYHRVGERTPIEVDLAASLFDEQMSFLREQCDVVTMTEGLARVAADAEIGVGGRPLVAVTFDDGTADLVDVALPILERHGIPSTWYVTTGFIEGSLLFPDDGLPVSWAGLRDAVATRLVDVGSHTHSHALLDRLPLRDIALELDRSIDLVGDRLGVAARHFAYPKALAGSAAADAAVRTRFASAALAGCRANLPGATDPWKLARSPVQKADGMRWFEKKVRGGMGFEDTLRRVLNGRRYAGDTA
jgi:peptidoglycan/xylan/chitin deacetylase (PgdA/CDA1 family)